MWHARSIKGVAFELPSAPVGHSPQEPLQRLDQEAAIGPSVSIRPISVNQEALDQEAASGAIACSIDHVGSQSQNRKRRRSRHRVPLSADRLVSPADKVTGNEMGGPLTYAQMKELLAAHGLIPSTHTAHAASCNIDHV